MKASASVSAPAPVSVSWQHLPGEGGKGEAAIANWYLFGATLRDCSNCPPCHCTPNEIYGPPLGPARSSELVTHLSSHCPRAASGYAYKTLRQLSQMQMLCYAQGASGGGRKERGRGVSACAKGVAMAKHVMNCLFGHSINFRLYDAAAAAAA